MDFRLNIFGKEDEMDENSNTVAQAAKFDWVEVEKWAKIMEEERKAENKVVRANFLKELRAIGADELVSSYDGYGDEGNVHDLGVFKEVEDEQLGAIKTPLKLPSGMQDKLKDFVWSFAYAKSPGFEINEGGFGTLTWDLGTDNITLEHSNRYMETEDYVWEDL